jgi:hypothetical protein
MCWTLNEENLNESISRDCTVFIGLNKLEVIGPVRMNDIQNSEWFCSTDLRKYNWNSGKSRVSVTDNVFSPFSQYIWRLNMREGWTFDFFNYIAENWTIPNCDKGTLWNVNCCYFLKYEVIVTIFIILENCCNFQRTLLFCVFTCILQEI